MSLIIALIIGGITAIGSLFGALVITSEHFINNTQTIRYLPKKDVLALQQFVQGCIVTQKEDIDTSKVDDRTLVKLLDRLGCGEAEESPVIR